MLNGATRHETGNAYPISANGIIYHVSCVTNYSSGMTTKYSKIRQIKSIVLVSTKRRQGYGTRASARDLLYTDRYGSWIVCRHHFPNFLILFPVSVYFRNRYDHYYVMKNAMH